MAIPNFFWLAQCRQHSVIISSNFYQTLQCVCKHPVDPRFSLIRTKFGLWCAGTCRSILPVITSRDDTMWEHSDRIFGRHNRGLWPFCLSIWRRMRRLQILKECVRCLETMRALIPVVIITIHCDVFIAFESFAAWETLSAVPSLGRILFIPVRYHYKQKTCTTSLV